jgi:hypothetical protein
MTMPIYTKDPGATKDYSFDWSDWLQTGETISTSSWSVTSGITQVSESETTTTTTIWLSGGAAGQRYLCTNTITSSGGRTEKKSIVIDIEGG